MPTTYAIPDGRVAMAATLYSGNNSTQSIANAVNGVGFQPNFVWFKSRATTYVHALFDSVRGVTKGLEANSTGAEQTSTAGNDLSAFTSTGFTVGAPQNWNSPNNSGSNPVAWQWKANGAAVTNTAGSITSQVSANTAAGFSVVTYTGTGANATVGHGLGVAPSMIIVKNRTTGGTSWNVYHISTGNTGAMYLELTNAFAADSTRWNNTSPTSSVFTVGTGAGVNGSSMVAYCFAPVAGYSAFGSYTGNGSADGVFVYTGLRARFLMIKRTDSSSGWVMLDTSRDPYNIVGNYLYANSAAADAGPSSNVLDINSNGFKIRNTWTDINANGGSYVYMAFAENPTKFSNAR